MSIEAVVAALRPTWERILDSAASGEAEIPENYGGFALRAPSLIAALVARPSSATPAAGEDILWWHSAAAPGEPRPDLQTAFRIASMTKSFTAASVLLSRDAGLIHLDDRIAVHLPHLRVSHRGADMAADLTWRHLLTMGAGLPTDDPWGDRQQDLPLADFDALSAHGWQAAWAPDVRFDYSNLGYALLGRALSALHTADYRDIVRTGLLEPLGLSRTGFTAAELGENVMDGFRVDPSAVDDARVHPASAAPSPITWQRLPEMGYGAFAPMGGLYSSVQDLTRWVGGYLAAWPQDGFSGLDSGAASVLDSRQATSHPLSALSRREQQRSHRLVPPMGHRTGSSQGLVAGYGLGFFHEFHPEFGETVMHSGGYPGFGSHMRWHPELGVGVIVLGNSTYARASAFGAQVLNDLVSAVGRASVQPDPLAEALLPQVVDLLEAWAADPEVAASAGSAPTLLAENVDQDLELHHRARHIAHLARRYGVTSFAPVVDRPTVSGFHRTWRVQGTAGQLQVALLFSPQSPPRIQGLSVTAVV